MLSTRLVKYVCDSHAYVEAAFPAKKYQFLSLTAQCYLFLYGESLLRSCKQCTGTLHWLLEQ